MLSLARRPPRGALTLATLLVSGLVFLLCAREAREARPDGIDQALWTWLDAERGGYPALTSAFRLATWLGDLPWSILACCGVAAVLGWLGRRGTLPRRLHEGTFWLMTFVTGMGFNYVLKLLFQRQRPPLDGRLVHVGESSFSFPSGHSAFAGLFFGLLALVLFHYVHRARWPGVALCVFGAMTVASSRVWLGVHYFTDVLAGLAVGVGWAIVAWRLHHRLLSTSQADRAA